MTTTTHSHSPWTDKGGHVTVFSVQEAWLSALGVIHGDGVHWLSWLLLCCLYSQQSDFDQRRHDPSIPFQLPRARSPSSAIPLQDQPF